MRFVMAGWLGLDLKIVTAANPCTTKDWLWVKPHHKGIGLVLLCVVWRPSIGLPEYGPSVAVRGRGTRGKVNTTDCSPDMVYDVLLRVAIARQIHKPIYIKECASPFPPKSDVAPLGPPEQHQDLR